MKLLLVGGVTAVVVCLALGYFSLAHFFAVNARAKDLFTRKQRVAEMGSDAKRTTARAKKRGAGA